MDSYGEIAQKKPSASLLLICSCNPAIRTLETPPEHVARSRSHTERVRHLDGLLSGGQREKRLASKKKHTFWILRFEEKATGGGRQSLSRLTHPPLRAEPNFFSVGVNPFSDNFDTPPPPHPGKRNYLSAFSLATRAPAGWRIQHSTLHNLDTLFIHQEK